MAKLDERIGFIAGGNMAFAIGSGLVNRGKLIVEIQEHFYSYRSLVGIIKPSQVLVSGPNIENLTRWQEMGADITEDNGKVSYLLT